MRRAIELSRDNRGGGPFGALVVVRGRIVGEGRNQVVPSRDPTAHAEINAIRAACQEVGSHSLEGAVLYTSCEPCPMCLAAAFWARVGRIVWANSRADATAIGFDDEAIYREVSLSPGERAIPSSRLLAAEALAVLREWAARPDRTMY